MTQSTFDLQGHRGCRGLMPENTVPAFLKAIELGAQTLEMDVVISADQEIVVSHEPWMSHVICSHPDGTHVKQKEKATLNLYHMKYTEIQQFDCGMRGNLRFPHQQKIKVSKPTLKVVVKSSDKHAKDIGLPAPKFNIEIKSEEKDYGVYQPQPKSFVRLIVDEIRTLGIEDRTIIQSFDINVLELLHKEENRKYSISYLVYKGKKLNTSLKKITFIPEVFSPNYQLVSEQMVKDCHALGIKIIPWTVNDQKVMDQLKAWGCDGGITDILF
jgi:glycerophosphoryl diester phosphodiesterase